MKEEKALTPEDIMRDYKCNGEEIDDLRCRNGLVYIGPMGYSGDMPIQIEIKGLRYFDLSEPYVEWKPLTPKDTRPKIKEDDFVLIYEHGRIIRAGRFDKSFKDGFLFKDGPWYYTENMEKILRVNPNEETTTEVRL